MSQSRTRQIRKKLPHFSTLHGAARDIADAHRALRPFMRLRNGRRHANQSQQAA